MFKELESFRDQVKSLNLSIGFVAGEQITVIVAPVVEPEAAKSNPALAQPFSFTATATELDEGFAAALGACAPVRKTLAEQAAAQAAALAAKVKAPGKPTGKVGASGKPSPVDLAADDDDATSAAAVAEPQLAAPPSSAASDTCGTINSAADLFDEDDDQGGAR